MSETIFWFRRDLRLDDNAGLYFALKEKGNVRPIFIFDSDILEKLNNPLDRRVTFLHGQLLTMKQQFAKHGAVLEIYHGRAVDVFEQLLAKGSIGAVYTNHDYEPKAIRRDALVKKLCVAKNAEFKTYKDQVIFEDEEVLTDGRKPYTVYTPYKKKWLASLADPFYLKSYPTQQYFKNLKQSARGPKVPSLKEMGFEKVNFEFPSAHPSVKTIATYEKTRDLPALESGTTHVGMHLRFGTVSVREMARLAKDRNAVWLSELIWREFFMQILFHFPQVENSSYRSQYEQVEWRENKSEFQRWVNGETGYPLVDAGMRQLSQTGTMHNRVRMITASFLTKHLLMYWSKGERHFARELLDYELSSNNGNWQWAAGTGCDAAPYFRVFNPETQARRFDPKDEYIRRWVPEFGTARYPAPMVEHVFARARCLAAFKKALTK